MKKRLLQKNISLIITLILIISIFAIVIIPSPVKADILIPKNQMDQKIHLRDGAKTSMQGAKEISENISNGNILYNSFLIDIDYITIFFYDHQNQCDVYITILFDVDSEIDDKLEILRNLTMGHTSDKNSTFESLPYILNDVDSYSFARKKFNDPNGYFFEDVKSPTRRIQKEITRREEPKSPTPELIQLKHIKILEIINSLFGLIFPSFFLNITDIDYQKKEEEKEMDSEKNSSITENYCFKEPEYVDELQVIEMNYNINEVFVIVVIQDLNFDSKDSESPETHGFYFNNNYLLFFFFCLFIIIYGCGECIFIKSNSDFKVKRVLLPDTINLIRERLRCNKNQYVIWIYCFNCFSPMWVGAYRGKKITEEFCAYKKGCPCHICDFLENENVLLEDIFKTFSIFDSIIYSKPKFCIDRLLIQHRGTSMFC